MKSSVERRQIKHLLWELKSINSGIYNHCLVCMSGCSGLFALLYWPDSLIRYSFCAEVSFSVAMSKKWTMFGI